MTAAAPDLDALLADLAAHMASRAPTTSRPPL